jgi:hypothetical protein
MPYDLVRFSKGWKVCKRDDHDRCYSNNPIPLDNAKRQRIAMYIHERKKRGGMLEPSDPESIRRGEEACTPGLSSTFVI